MLIVASLLPCRHFLTERLDIGDAAIQALAAQDGEFDLHHVEPGGMLGRVVELQLLGEASCFCR